ncbi:hypothetical protein [Methylobrevis pamukkalensis]|uniref:hypothetical protein n=1 Tax=Methylobrevis pamukkalensis TaxID=1439726 RepID=UPI00114D0D80|nr:hypothetical protein [Methylobrevis pamukkalensis]
MIDRVTVPGGAMGPNGALRISALWQYTDSATNKILRARTAAAGGDGLTGHTVAEVTVSTTRTFIDTRIWRNQNSQSVQAGFRAAATNAIAGTATTDYATGAQDTSVDFDVVFTAELASGSANAQLVWWMVEVFHGA